MDSDKQIYGHGPGHGLGPANRWKYALINHSDTTTDMDSDMQIYGHGLADMDLRK